MATKLQTNSKVCPSSLNTDTAKRRKFTDELHSTMPPATCTNGKNNTVASHQTDNEMFEDLCKYRGELLKIARQSHSWLEIAARFVENKLFGDPFHQLKVELDYELGAEGRTSPDGLRIALLEDEREDKKMSCTAVHELVHAKDNLQGSPVKKQLEEHGIKGNLRDHIIEGRARYSEYIFNSSKTTEISSANRKIMALQAASMAGAIISAAAVISQFFMWSAESWSIIVGSLAFPALPQFEIAKIKQKLSENGKYYDFSHKLYQIGKMLGNTQEDHIEVFKMCTKKIPRTWHDMENLDEFYREEIAEIQKRKSSI